MIAQSFGLVDKIVGIDADAVSPYKTGIKTQSIPFGIHGLDDFLGLNAHLAKDHGKFIHEGNIDIPLGIFDQFGGFGDLNGGSAIDSSFNDGSLDVSHCIQRFPVHSGDNLDNVEKPVLAVARIDAFR